MEVIIIVFGSGIVLALMFIMAVLSSLVEGIRSLYTVLTKIALNQTYIEEQLKELNRNAVISMGDVGK